ncbi:MAG: hypothetical protein QOK49_1745 [Baekduia sp.]|nr:hypothetical protein [Baekduia sp.]
MVSVRRRAVLSLTVALAALLPATAADAATPKRARLVAFDSCQALVGYARANAARTGGGVGVPVRALGAAPQTLARPGQPLPTARPQTDQTSGEVAPTASGGAPPAPAFSGTNVQETGIDEPDIVKTDGRSVLVLAGDQLRVIDVTGAAPVGVGTLALEPGAAHQLLLRGDRALILSSTYDVASVDVSPAGGGPVGVAAPRIAPAPVTAGPTTVLTEVDLTDRAAPKVARTMTLDGRYVDARMTGSTVRVVVDSTPAPTVQPLQRAPLRAFVPATTIRSRISHRTFRRGVVGCTDVRHPDAFSGLDLLTVLTVDLDRGLYDVDRDAIMAGAQTVYASDKSLYVASQRYVRGLQDTGDVPGSMRTEIHRFDASTAGATTYAGSGSVPGFVANAYALSEADGALRVASTDEPAWLPDGPPSPAESYVTVLARQDGARLGQVGQVGGLGKGQRIYGVRFAGPVGYVVTFKQVDPLYTLDLSSPTAPRVAGALEIPGYSAYLHPIGDGLLLGVGQEVSADGRPQGTQVSLFDVSDLAAPKRVGHVVFGHGSSDAEFDPHAFLWWAPAQMAVLPLTSYDSSGDPASGFVGAVGLRVTAGAITETGRVTHGDPAQRAPIARSLVIGDRLYTLSYAGLGSARLDTLAPVAFLPFG